MARVSIAAVQARNQGIYRAVVQRGPFGGLEGNIPASVEISEVRRAIPSDAASCL